jgi:hypothetical protein
MAVDIVWVNKVEKPKYDKAYPAQTKEDAALAEF